MKISLEINFPFYIVSVLRINDSIMVSTPDFSGEGPGLYAPWRGRIVLFIFATKYYILIYHFLATSRNYQNI
jgi:hypothetical protein